MAAGMGVFLMAGGGLLPLLPGKPALLISLGAFFFGLGEWRNHPLQTRLLGHIKITAYHRSVCSVGVLFDLLGVALIGYGLWHLIN